MKDARRRIEDARTEVNLCCERCGKPVTGKNGWFAWFERDGLIEDCVLSCHGEDGCAARIERVFKHHGCNVYDHHLQTFIGRENLERTLALVETYSWKPTPLRKLLRYVPLFLGAA